MPENETLTLVPWFSTEEWLEVYDGLFSNDISLWKDARDTILVWEARMGRLPPGVNVTLPVLQAKLAEADPSMDYSIKSVMLATAVQRFVTAAVLLGDKHVDDYTMSGVALNMGLPVYLVGLRNEIIHGGKGWTGGQTMEEAVETCFQWIKGYYWDKEYERLQPKEMAAPTIPEEDWKNFIKLLDRFAKYAIPKKDDKDKGAAHVKVCKDVIKALRELYPRKPEDCMEAVVTHVLMPARTPNLLQRLQTKTKRRCCCFFRIRILTCMNSVMSALHYIEGSTELLVSCLIKKGEENAMLACEWIKLLLASLLSPSVFFRESKNCHKHILHLKRDLDVDWNVITLQLCEAEQDWTSEIAKKLVRCPLLSFTRNQRKKINSLIKIMQMQETEEETDDNEETEELQKEGYFDVEDLMTEAEKCPGNSFFVLNSLRREVLPPGGFDLPPIGVLPHQRDNPLFYKELLLNYPENTNEPPTKRQKSS